MTIVVVVAVVVDVDDLVVGCSAAMQDSERFCAEPAPGMGSLLRWAVPVDHAHLAESFPAIQGAAWCDVGNHIYGRRPSSGSLVPCDSWPSSSGSI